jgi:hypothetical protein
MSDIVDIGAASLDPETGMVVAQCKGAEVEGGEAPDYGALNLMFGLGFAAVPAPANENGNAQAVLLDDCPGQDGVCVGAVDSRTTQTYYELGPGETAVFSTGEGFDSRILFKDQLVAIVVSDDVAIVIDRKNKKITTAAFGMVDEMSDANGRVMTDETGKASIQLKNGVISLTGTVVLGGRTPTSPVGLPGAPSLPAPGVFVGS